ncbi:MAG: DUF1631 domain-containing protein [Gammaproteobacteria bacterium]|nr:DUF1631 domain-containing protein [Gammaproteobacteria bacterium]
MSQKTQAQNREILTGTRAIMVGFCETQGENFLTESCESLFTQSERAKADNEGRQLYEARQSLESGGSSIRRLLDERLKKQFKACFPSRSRSDAPAQAAQAIEDLGLVDEAQMEITVAVNSMAHRVESEHADQLYALAQRMALLNSGIKIEDDLTPYSPHTFYNAYLKFVDNDTHEQAVKLVLLKVFERFFLHKLGSLYEELNQYLVSANVLPNLKHKTSNLVQPRRRKSDENSPAPQRRQDDIYKAIESILHTENVPIDPRSPVMPVEQVISEIFAQQQQQRAAVGGDWLSQPAAPVFPATNTLALQQVLQVISTLFGMVNTETTVASPVKNLLSHLQTPYAQIALQDPDFLQDPQHVARQLFSSMLGASERWTDDETDSSNELVQRINTVVERIMSESQGDVKQDMALFGELLQEFTGYVENFERKVKLTEQRSVQAAQGREKLRENQLKVEETIAEKIGDETLPLPISELITEVWSSFMTYTLLRHGEGTEQWKEAARTIDTVLWYIEPKTNAAETKLADDIRHSLHETLENGMQNVGLDAGEIKSKLTALDLCQKLATENAAEHGGSPSAEQSSHASSSGADASSSAKRNKAASAANSKKAAAKPSKSAANSNAASKNTAGKKASGKNTAGKTKSRIAMQQESAKQQESATQKTKPGKAKDGASPDMLGKLAKSLDKKAAVDSAHTKTRKTSVIKPVRKASETEIEKVLSMKFGTWLYWNKPGEKPQEVKLTWYNSRTQNCMLSNSKGKEIAVVTANVIALGMQDGWIEVLQREKKKPLFERVLETFSSQAQSESAQPKAASYTKH